MSRERQKLPRPGRPGNLNRGRLFNNRMGIGAANAKRTDASHTPAVCRLPWLQLLLHVERTVCEIDRRIGPLEVQAWMEHSVL